MLSLWVVLLFTGIELILLVAILFFFLRLRRSENLVQKLQANQEILLARLQHNAELEKELVATFAQRQAELRTLDTRMEDRAEELRRLVSQAEGITRSPQFLRELILNQHGRGVSANQIAKNAGLTVDEVELILTQAGAVKS